MSHNFCVNCCGDIQKLNCDGQNKTCSKLANFLVGCNIYKEPINEEELDELARKYAEEEYQYDLKDEDIDFHCCIEDFKAGYRKAWEDKQ